MPRFFFLLTNDRQLSSIILSRLPASHERKNADCCFHEIAGYAHKTEIVDVLKEDADHLVFMKVLAPGLYDEFMIRFINMVGHHGSVLIEKGGTIGWEDSQPITRLEYTIACEVNVAIVAKLLFSDDKVVSILEMS